MKKFRDERGEWEQITGWYLALFWALSWSAGILMFLGLISCVQWVSHALGH